MFSYISGPLFKKIIEDTERKVNQTLDPANRNMFIYSGHDITLSTVFTVLGIWNKTTPPVGSYILFEVHYINETYGFKVRNIRLCYLFILKNSFKRIYR